MTILGILLLLPVIPVYDEPLKPRSIRDQLPPELVKEIRSLEDDYGIAIELVQAPFAKTVRSESVIQGQPVTVDRIITDLRVFVKECRLYPPRYIRKLRVSRVYFCNNLKRGNVDVAGLIDRSADSIYFCVDTRENNHPYFITHTQICTLHHELFHFFDYRARADIYVDKDWAQLNPPSFKYFELQKMDDDAVRVTNLFPGFISRYAENNIAEDKAETFSHMMLNMHEMECRGKDDTILGKKIEYLKQKMKEVCPEMDENYWTKLRYLERPRLTMEDPWADANPKLPPLPERIEAPKTVMPFASCNVMIKRHGCPRFLRSRR